MGSLAKVPLDILLRIPHDAHMNHRIGTLLLWITILGFGSLNLVFWYAWIVIGIIGGAMTTEAGPGRAW